jgi:hypothetical protein
VTLTERSKLSTVALAVGEALRRHRIRAVLTGGACASLYTRGMIHSKDIDFVLSGEVMRSQLDQAMSSVGFIRQENRYEHPLLPFYVEFPKGPLAIGHDYNIHPVEIRRSDYRTLALSRTDCIRDRLAAFYHWHDRQSLHAAVLVAATGRPRMKVIEEWSHREGASIGFEEFKKELSRRKAAR